MYRLWPSATESHRGHHCIEKTNTETVLSHTLCLFVCMGCGGSSRQVMVNVLPACENHHADQLLAPMSDQQITRLILPGLTGTQGQYRMFSQS